MIIRRALTVALCLGSVATACSGDDEPAVNTSPPATSSDLDPATTDTSDAPPVPDHLGIDPEPTEAPPDVESTPDPPTVGGVLGVGAVEIVTAASGGGERPLLEWNAVEGADEYHVVALAAFGGPYWAWVGQATSVVFGGGDAGSDPGQLATVFEPLTWTVAAFDPDGNLLALSAPSPLAP